VSVSWCFSIFELRMEAKSAIFHCLISAVSKISRKTVGLPKRDIWNELLFMSLWVFKLSTVIVVLVSEVFLLYLYCLYQVITPSTNCLSIYKMWTVFGHRWQGRRCTSFPNFVKFTVIWITNCQQLPAFRARVNATGCGRYFLSFIKLPVSISICNSSLLLGLM